MTGSRERAIVTSEGQRHRRCAGLARCIHGEMRLRTYNDPRRSRPHSAMLTSQERNQGPLGLRGPPGLEEVLPLLTDFRQALEANICLTREGRHITPGLSLSIKISSSMSWGPKVQFLLVGKETNLALSVTGAKRINWEKNPLFEKH